MKAVILAGGLATRMGELCLDTPKPMTMLCGKPVLLHQLEALKNEGISDFIFLVGHLSEKITDFFGNGSAFGVSISYFHEKEPLGTAGALFKIKPEEDFLLCNGDLVFNFSLRSMLAFHRKNKALATLFVHPNSHPHDSALIEANRNGKITKILQKHESKSTCRNLCNAGLHIISPKLLEMFDLKGKANLDRDIIEPAISTGRIYAYRSFEYVSDMGTPERLSKVERDLIDKVPERRHKDKVQKAVFLDRDGTINIHKGFITFPDEIELIPYAADAIKAFRAAGYLVIVITNQPVIARGDCSKEELEKIHGRLEMLLGKEGAFLDDIYYCPHHPDSGFDGEIKELKIKCTCRKPSPGLILQAQKDYNINLSQSFMVGDSEADYEAGKAAGCTPILLSDDATHNEYNNTFRDLYDFSKAFKS